MGVASVVILDTHGLDAAAAAYGTLLGAPSVQSDGPCQWQVGSTRLVVRGGDGGPRVLVPAIDLVDPQSADVFVGAGALLARRARAVVPAEPIAGARTAVVDGLPVGIVDTAGLAPVDPDRSGDIVGLDHIVMSSGSRDEALALFGAVLDFDFRLEQNLSLGDRERHQLDEPRPPSGRGLGVHRHGVGGFAERTTPDHQHLPDELDQLPPPLPVELLMDARPPSDQVTGREPPGPTLFPVIHSVLRHCSPPP